MWAIIGGLFGFTWIISAFQIWSDPNCKSITFAPSGQSRTLGFSCLTFGNGAGGAAFLFFLIGAALIGYAIFWLMDEFGEPKKPQSRTVLPAASPQTRTELEAFSPEPNAELCTICGMYPIVDFGLQCSNCTMKQVNEMTRERKQMYRYVCVSCFQRQSEIGEDCRDCYARKFQLTADQLEIALAASRTSSEQFVCERCGVDVERGATHCPSCRVNRRNWL
jgi:ribosomal protein L40E